MEMKCENMSGEKKEIVEVRKEKDGVFRCKECKIKGRTKDKYTIPTTFNPFKEAHVSNMSQI